MPDHVYQLSKPDPTTGEVGVFKFTSPRELSNEDLMRKSDELFGHPPPQNIHGELGPGSEGSPTVDAGRAIMREVPAIAGATLLPEAVPLAGGASMAARGALSAVGEGLGSIVGSVAGGEGVPDAMQSGIRGAAAGATQMAVDAAGKMLFTPSGQEEIANGLRSVVTNKFSLAATPEIQAGEQRLSGMLIQDALPKAYAAVDKTKTGLYQVRRNLGKSIPPVSVPNGLVSGAQQALDGLGDPAASLYPQADAKARGVLKKIVDRGTPTTRKVIGQDGKAMVGPNGKEIVDAAQPKPLTHAELLDWESDLRDALPDFSGRMYQTSEGQGILQNTYNRVRGQVEAMERPFPNVARAGDKANEYFRTVVAPFRDAADSIAKEKIGPSEVVNTIVHKPDRFLSLMPNLTPDTQKALRSAWFADAIGRSTDEHIGTFSGEKFLKEWTTLNPLVRKSLAGGNAAEVEGFVDKMATNLRKQSMQHATSRIAGTGVVAGSLLNSVREFKNGNMKEGTAFLFGGAVAPLILPTILSDPKLLRKLSTGLDLPTGTVIARRYGAIVAQTVSHALGAVSGVTGPTSQDINPELP